MSGEIRIENWSVGAPSDGYTPPELRCKVLRGEVYGHPVKHDGDRVTTSAIARVDGTLVTVISGHKYRLGKIADDYRAYLDKEGFIFNENEPIAFNKRAPRKSGLL